MATFYTEFQSVEHFATVNDSMGPNFTDLDVVFDPMDQFLGDGGPRSFDNSIGVFDQTAQHRTGTTSHGGPPSGDFLIVGTTLDTSTLHINALVYNPQAGGTFLLTSAGGITLGATADNPSAGTINHMFFEQGTPEVDGHNLFDLNGALSFATHTLTVSRIHVEQTEAGATISGTLTGNFTFGEDTMGNTVVKSGTITGMSFDIDGTVFEGSGFSVSALTFFNAQTHPDIEALFVLIGSGNDVVTGNGGDGQVLKGYAGNDLLIAGANNGDFFGGLGNDTIDLGSYTGSEVIEDSVVGGGIDTVRTNLTHTLEANVERLVLTGLDNVDGMGNELANVITGNAGNNWLQGFGGADSVVGGGGGDVFYADNVGDKFGAEAADGSYDTVYSSVNQTLGANFEDLYLEGVATIGTGNDQANHIYGNDIASVLTGKGGDDSIYGAGANDKIDGGDGNDYILAGAGANTILGGGGDDTIAGGNDNPTDSDVIDAGAGNDNVDGGEGADSLSGGAGADSIYGSFENDLINGGDGNDVLYGESGANTIFGGGGDDLITSESSADSVDGGAGIDTHVMNAGEVTITMGGGTENLIFTNAISSFGTGNALANTFTSGVGVDGFDGKGGNDTYNLNDNDTASEDSSGGGTGDLVVFTTATGSTHTLGSGIEKLTVFGSEAGGVGNELANVLTSGAGNNNFDGKAGNDTYNVQSDDSAGENDEGGGGGNDLVIATLEDEQSFTNLGTFIERLTLLHTGEGTISGTGNSLGNVITGANNANNALYGGEGPTGADTLIGGALNDDLFGGDGADSLLGGAGDDYLEGGSEADTMVGGAGDDVYWRDLTTDGITVTIDGDVMTDTGGSDTVWFGSSMADTLGGGTYTRDLTGPFSMIDNLDASAAGGNLIKFNFTGSAGNNKLIGADQADTLNGGAGNDWLDGGAGNDQLIGGLGDDSYVLTLLNGGGGNATITNLGEVNDSGGTGDVMVLTGGDGNSAIFSYTIDSSPFEGIDASSASSALYFDFHGNAAGNLLVGGLAADTAGGHDTLTGGQGNDTYGVNYGDTVNEVSGGGGNADLVIAYLLNDQGWSLVNGDGIENLTLVDIDVGTTIGGFGNELANRITGDGHADNFLDGGDGAAKDTLIGGAGDDTLRGAGGADSLIGGLGDDTYILSFDTAGGALAALPDAILDSGGIDTLMLSDGNGVTLTYTLGATFENLDAHLLSASVGGTQKLTGNALDNLIIASHGINSVVGGAGNDTLEGGSDGSTSTLDGGLGDDLYVESSGNDTFLISQAGDTIEVGESGGNDTVIVSVAGGHEVLDLSEFYSFIENATFTGTGSVQIIGNDSNNTLIGAAGNDTIYSGDGSSFNMDGDDSLAGNAGNDILDGGEGADTLVGGLGNDDLRGGNADTGGQGGTDYGDSLTGNAGNDTLDGGEGGADTLLGGDGNDSLYGGDDDGGAGPSNDILNGDAGNDTLDGGNGADTLSGGIGNDSMYGGAGNDSMDGSAGNDYLYGGSGNNTLVGGDGADTLEGGGDADSIVGNAGNDSLDGGGGNDSMTGGAGDDTYFVEGDDVITEVAGQGNDSVLSNASSYTLSGAIERLTLIENVVVVQGTGNATANTITGNSYNNILAGGGGNDTVTGGDGGDYFYLANVTAGNVMAIQDFDQAEGDKLQLDAGAFGGLLGPIPPDVVTNGLAATANHAQFIYTYGTGASLGSLYYDADGTGAGAKVLVATFAAGTKPVELTNSDFIAGPV